MLVPNGLGTSGPPSHQKANNLESDWLNMLLGMYDANPLPWLTFG